MRLALSWTTNITLFVGWPPAGISEDMSLSHTEDEFVSLVKASYRSLGWSFRFSILGRYGSGGPGTASVLAGLVVIGL